MGASYHLTGKISVYKNNQDQDKRVGHLAYLVCYHNSYRMRNIMQKSEPGDIDDHETPLRVFDEDNSRKWRKIAKPRRYSEPGLLVDAMKPLCFKQVRFDVLVSLYSSDVCPTLI